MKLRGSPPPDKIIVFVIGFGVENMRVYIGGILSSMLKKTVPSDSQRINETKVDFKGSKDSEESLFRWLLDSLCDCVVIASRTGKVETDEIVCSLLHTGKAYFVMFCWHFTNRVCGIHLGIRCHHIYE